MTIITTESILKPGRNFIGFLRQQFNSSAIYKERFLKWDTIAEQKAMELSRFLLDRSQSLDFEEPSPVLERLDTSDFRSMICLLTQRKATKLGIGKSVLHYLRRNTKSSRPFKVHPKTRED